MSTNVFIWIKHGTHRWFEQITFQNCQNYPPILRPHVSDAPRRDSHAPKSVKLICNAQCFLSFSNFTFIFKKKKNYSITTNVYYART